MEKCSFDLKKKKNVFHTKKKMEEKQHNSDLVH